MKFFWLSQEYIDNLSNSPYTYGAFAYALYEIAKPVRYTVTVGLTTVAVKYLSEKGILKTSNLKSELKEQKDKGQEKISEFKEKGKDRLKEIPDKYTEEWQKFINSRKKKKDS